MQWMFSGLIQVLSVQESSLRVVQICVTLEIRAEMCTRLRENVIELNNITWKCNWAHLSTFSLFLDLIMQPYDCICSSIGCMDLWYNQSILFPNLVCELSLYIFGFFFPQCIREMNFQLNPIQLLNYKVMDHLVETKTKISSILPDFCIDDQTPDFVKDQSNVRTQTTTN